MESNYEALNLLFIGTYSQNIHIFRMDSISGYLEKISSSPSTSSPSYLAIHPNKRWIYAVNEFVNTVSSFSFDSINKKLSFNNSVSSEGGSPCHVSIDNSGKYVMTANYGGGNVVVFPIESDGKLQQASSFDQHSGSGPNSQRQESPHAHMIMQSENNFIYSADLGLDKIFCLYPQHHQRHH
ncbi:MAG: lactonase family protein [Bacteroidales bacterium]|nr:lactonase family protein [Bacteroidales bacterium]